LSQQNQFSTRVVGLAVVAVLAYLLFFIFSPFFAPIYWAFLAAFMLFPLNQRLRKAFRGRNGLAASVMTIGVALGIATPAAVGMVAFARQAVELGQSVSRLGQRYQIEGVEDLLRLPLIGGAAQWLENHSSIDGAQVQGWVVQGAQSAVQFLLSHSRDVLFGALGIFGNLTLTLFILFFFFRDGDAMAERAWGLIPLDLKRKTRLNQHLQEVTRAVVFGTLITALVQGALLGVGFWITGLTSPLVFGVLAAVASFIPFVGTALVWVPAALYLLAQGVAWKTIFLVAWSALVVGSADNVLRPMLVSGKARMGTLTVFFGVLGGLAAFGFIGLFLGPVILALVLTLIEFGEEGEAPSSESRVSS
jgi:predicted PurR-regulated permease PerM